MICNFGRRSGIDALAGKIRNGFKIDVEDIRVINPVITNQSNTQVPSKANGGTSFRVLMTKVIRLPWVFLKSRIELLIDLKLSKLHQEIQVLKKRIENLEANNPPAHLIHRNKSWKANQNI
jgi:hypothetical protein